MTPLQMALVAAAIANDGTIMEPHLVKKVTRAGRRHGREASTRRSGSTR